MPWTGPEFHHHNLGLSPAQDARAAAIANHVLKSTGNEGEAIATANSLIHRDSGGMISASPDPTPGLQPATANQGPQAQSIIQRFSAMSAEQLRELVPRLSGQMATFAQRVLQQKQMAPQQAVPQQAVPAMPQYGLPAQQPTQFASGGGMQPRQSQTVPILAAGGEFVVNPDHVARWGKGDLKEGHRLLDKFVVDARSHIVRTTKALKPPVKS